MKHFWVGSGILGILLGLSLWSAAVLEKIHTPLQQDLEAAAESVMAADWETAQALASRAEVRWQKERNKIAALASHNTMEEIDHILATVPDVVQYLRDMSPIWDALEKGEKQHLC